MVSNLPHKLALFSNVVLAISTPACWFGEPGDLQWETLHEAMTISTRDTEKKGHSLKNKHKIPEYPEIKVTATKHS